MPPPSPPIVTARDQQDCYALLWGEIENTSIAIGARGCVGAEWVAATERTILYWFDAIPQEIAAIIRRWGLPLEVRFVPFAPDVLRTQCRKLAGDPAVTSAGFGHDFQSIAIRIRTGASAADIARLGQDIPIAPEPAIAARFPAVSGIPVVITTIIGRHGPLLTRTDRVSHGWAQPAH